MKRLFSLSLLTLSLFSLSAVISDSAHASKKTVTIGKSRDKKTNKQRLKEQNASAADSGKVEVFALRPSGATIKLELWPSRSLGTLQHRGKSDREGRKIHFQYSGNNPSTLKGRKIRHTKSSYAEFKRRLSLLPLPVESSSKAK